MKNVLLTKKLVVLFALVILPIISFSQSQNNNGHGNGNGNGNGKGNANGQDKWDTWSLDGNEVKSNDVLGTTNNQPLRIVTKDSVRMEIKANGDVQMNKNAAINGKLDVGIINGNSLSLNTGNTPRFLINPAGDALFYRNATISGILNVNAINSNGDLLFKTNNLPRFSIFSNGNVQAENNMIVNGNLRIKGLSGDENFVFADKDGNLIKKSISDTLIMNNIRIKDAIMDNAIIKNTLQIGTHTLHVGGLPAQALLTISTDDGENLLIQSTIGATNTNTAINANNTGTVGIGMIPLNNPADKLQVKGTVRASAFSLSDGSIIAPWLIDRTTGNVKYKNPDQFLPANVGIGLDIPLERLHINDGRIRVDGNGITTLLSSNELIFNNDKSFIRNNYANGGYFAITGQNQNELVRIGTGGDFTICGDFSMYSYDNKKLFSMYSDGGGIVIGSNEGHTSFEGMNVGYNNISSGPIDIKYGARQEKWTSDQWPTRITSPNASAWVCSTPNGIGKYMGIGMAYNGWFFISSSSISGAATPAAPEYPFSVSTTGDVHIAGNVGIGTCPQSGYVLSVNGPIVATAIDVKLFTACDYVFKPNYKLRSLNEVESYIKENSHLPEVPSAAEMDSNGVNLANMNSILLKKVEELTLYLIDQNKKIEEQQKELISLKKQMEESMK
jgi:hypothetical protein